MADTTEAERMRQLRRQAAARAAFLKGVPLLESAAVGRLLGSGNTSATVNRLRHEGRLFAVTHRGVALYPAAQIIDGEPSPAIPRVLEAFSRDAPWTVALWLNAPCGWLDGKKPIDLISTDPDRVVRAARRSAEPVRF